MKKITDIYTLYNIMPNLQLHQLRVAAVASQICDSLDVDVDKEKIITTCLLHDMGNIIKADFSRFPDFLEPEGVEYWKEVKDHFVRTYGNKEDLATLAIMKELGVLQDLQDYAHKLDFAHVCKTKQGEDLTLKVIKYSDLRVGPYGVLSYEDRMNDVKERYSGRAHLYQDREELILCGKELESQVFSHSNIKPEDISDESVASQIEILKNFEI